MSECIRLHPWYEMHHYMFEQKWRWPNTWEKYIFIGFLAIWISCCWARNTYNVCVVYHKRRDQVPPNLSGSPIHQRRRLERLHPGIKRCVRVKIVQLHQIDRHLYITDDNESRRVLVMAVEDQSDPEKIEEFLKENRRKTTGGNLDERSDWQVNHPPSHIDADGMFQLALEKASTLHSTHPV